VALILFRTRQCPAATRSADNPDRQREEEKWWWGENGGEGDVEEMRGVLGGE